MTKRDLSNRQKRCLLAMLAIYEEEERNGHVHRNSGKVASLLGFKHGPIQHGRGAMSRRSFSGTGSIGKWTGPPLMGLTTRGYLSARYERDNRIRSYYLTESGRILAWKLRDDDGLEMTDPDAADKTDYYGRK